MPTITFLPSGRVCPVEEGTTILQASRAHQIGLSHCCGGRALCTTCRVIVQQGIDHLSDIEEHEYDMLELLHLGPSYRLGCQARIYGDVVVRIPD
ncbi:MAG: 2Fe-2S ferredoxin [Acidobacteria bacterium]|nr:MAG: 2Fe-2S ferredoxin [Acidobacteriota bacterium]